MYRGIYDSPYGAFTNYMNILADFMNRVNNLYPSEIENEELNALLTTIKNQGEEIEIKNKEIVRLNARLKKLEAAQPVEEEGTKPATKTKRTTAKKK